MSDAGTLFTIVTGDGLMLRCARWGGGPLDLVFVHGAGLSAQTYWPALRAIGDAATIHGFNSRGHGGSDVPRVVSPYDEPYDDLVRFVSRSLRCPIVMAGHSFGAFLTLRLAAEHPELVQGIILVDPLITYEPDGSWQTRIMDMDAGRIARTRGKPGAWPDRAAAEAWLTGRSGFRRWDREALALYLATCLRETAAGVELCCPPWMEALLYLHRPFVDFWPWIRRIVAPAAILYGEESEVALAPAIEHAARLLPRAAVRRMRGGHNFAQEYPRETGEALRDALSIATGDC